MVVPPKGRAKVLTMLHKAYPGIARMKRFARGYVRWPGIDEQMENCVKGCEACQVNSKSPATVPLHPWSWPEKPWSRIHIDYAGSLQGKMFTLKMDAISKWLIHFSSYY